MGKLKAILKAVIGVPCLVVGVYFFITMFIGLYTIISGGLIGAIAGVVVIIVSGIICIVTLPIAYICLRGIKKDWKE